MPPRLQGVGVVGLKQGEVILSIAKGSLRGNALDVQILQQSKMPDSCLQISPELLLVAVFSPGDLEELDQGEFEPDYQAHVLPVLEPCLAVIKAALQTDADPTRAKLVKYIAAVYTGLVRVIVLGVEGTATALEARAHLKQNSKKPFWSAVLAHPPSMGASVWDFSSAEQKSKQLSEELFQDVAPLPFPVQAAEDDLRLLALQFPGDDFLPPRLELAAHEEMRIKTAEELQRAMDEANARVAEEEEEEEEGLLPSPQPVQEEEEEEEEEAVPPPPPPFLDESPQQHLPETPPGTPSPMHSSPEEEGGMISDEESPLPVPLREDRADYSSSEDDEEEVDRYIQDDEHADSDLEESDSEEEEETASPSEPQQHVLADPFGSSDDDDDNDDDDGGSSPVYKVNYSNLSQGLFHPPAQRLDTLEEEDDDDEEAEALVDVSRSVSFSEVQHPEREANRPVASSSFGDYDDITMQRFGLSTQDEDESEDGSENDGVDESSILSSGEDEQGFRRGSGRPLPPSPIVIPPTQLQLLVEEECHMRLNKQAKPIGAPVFHIKLSMQRENNHDQYSEVDLAITTSARAQEVSLLAQSKQTNFSRQLPNKCLVSTIIPPNVPIFECLQLELENPALPIMLKIACAVKFVKPEDSEDRWSAHMVCRVAGNPKVSDEVDSFENFHLEVELGRYFDGIDSVRLPPNEGATFNFETGNASWDFGPLQLGVTQIFQARFTCLRGAHDADTVHLPTIVTFETSGLLFSNLGSIGLAEGQTASSAPERLVLTQTRISTWFAIRCEV